MSTRLILKSGRTNRRKQIDMWPLFLNTGLMSDAFLVRCIS